MAVSPKQVHPFFRVLHTIEDLIVGGVLLVLVVFAFVQLLLKSLPTEITVLHHHVVILPFKWLIELVGPGFDWGDAFLRQLILWLAILGAAVATRQDRHINVEIASKFLPARWKNGVRIFTDAFTSVVCGLVAYAGVQLVKGDIGSGSTAFARVPAWFMELIIPIGFGIISLRYARYLVVHALRAFGLAALPPDEPTPAPREAA